MDVYSCRVRPGGNLHHDVTLHSVTAAEIAVLRHVHGGSETVFDIKRTGATKVVTRDEWERLAATYKLEPVRAVFGPVTQARLPETLDEDFADVDDAPAPVVKRTAKKVAKPAHVEPDADADETF